MSRRIAQVIVRTCAFILAACFAAWAANNYIYDVVVFIGFWGILVAGELALKYFGQHAKQKAKNVFHIYEKYTKSR